MTASGGEGTVVAPSGPSVHADEAAGSSPLRGLDEQLSVTTRAGWFSLVAVVTGVVAFIAWSFFGQAPSVVLGQGLVLPPDGVYEIGIASEGVVIDLSIDTGDRVVAGETVARVLTSEGTVVDVPSTVEGTVLQVLVKKGGYNVAGQPVATIEPDSEALEVVAFVPAAEGNQIEAGMRAYVAPSSAPAAEYGTVVGTVSSISPSPVSRGRIELLVGRSAALVDVLAGSEPVVEIRIDMERNPANVSGLQWSTGTGPAFDITSETLASVTVVVDDQRPIDRLLP